MGAKIGYFLIFMGAILLVVLWGRWFEWSSIYFPDKIVQSSPGLAGLEYEDVYFKTSDGVQINAWFVPSREARGTLLYCHGNAGNIGDRIDIIKMFSSLGLNVLIFDYRGYGKSAGIASEKGTYLDAEAAYEYLLSRNDVDKDKIIVYGKSLGGAVATELALKKNPRILISDSAFTSTTDMARMMYPFLPLEHILTIKYDTLSKIPRVESNKLIIHSYEDEIVPFKHGQAIYQKAQEPKEFFRMRGGHNEGIIAYESEYREYLDDYLTRSGI